MRLENNGSTSSQSTGGASSASGNGAASSNGVSTSPKAAEANGNGAVRNGSARAEAGSTASSFTMLAPPTPKSDYFGHDREEVTRILIQSLVDLGYHRTAGMLEDESEYTLETANVTEFRKAILRGEWIKAEQLLFNLEIQKDADVNALLFYMRQQKFLELLETRDVSRALQVLRTELTPLNQSVDKLHSLSSLMMCLSAEDLKLQAGWDGAAGISRRQLLSELSKSIAPSVMIPENRLASLLHQVKQTQISRCLYHNTANSPSLYSDHICDRNQFPLSTIHVLNDHSNEVWFVQFSHDGTRLATASRDCSVIIWDVENFEALHVLKEHTGGVACVRWSPDDSWLLSCSQDKKAKLWSAENGACLRTLEGHSEVVSSCAWAPDGLTFVTGSMDKDMILWNLHGKILFKWSGARIYDMVITPDGQKLAAICTNQSLHVYNFITRIREHNKVLGCNLTCITASKDSKHILINMATLATQATQATQEVQLLDIDTAEVVRRFVGHKQGEFVIRSCFGGADENFVVSGSEDSNVYVWHKENGTLVETLPGHTGIVNCVAWNPTNPHMFASAGDDRSVRIWSKAPQPNAKGKMKGVADGFVR